MEEYSREGTIHHKHLTVRPSGQLVCFFKDHEFHFLAFSDPINAESYQKTGVSRAYCPE